jgi:hypothetical protein
MKQIKTVTLQSVDYFSQVLSSKTHKASKLEIQYKIINFIAERGNRVFVDIFNETIEGKKYGEALKILNI